MRRGQRGSAVVDFVLVLVVLVPVVLGITQLALVLLVRNTLAAAASEGARYAATSGHGPSDGEAKAREEIDDAISGRFAHGVTAKHVVVDGAPGIEVTIRAQVPTLGIGGPSIGLSVTGHAVQEEP